ncbi:hypothetical protein [Myroides fluvii]|uniref:hypothetical protein n=1 Tax=Myroides fluvii TaxID=2572594 RepID=UPI00131D6128|nr:hypothetical protein [Myroides fluvii]
MTIFSYHLAQVSFFSSLRILLFPPKAKYIKGLIHADTMHAMVLGSPVFSPARFLIRRVVVFAQWENETALEHYLATHSIGKKLAKGWHTRLQFVRQWGTLSNYQIPAEGVSLAEEEEAVVAVTLARMRYFQIPRFIRWGRPTEQLVRDHPAPTLALASFKFPTTISTFSIWPSLKSMTDMVQGHSQVAQPQRHREAMQERNRKDFHVEFSTLRFKPLAEYGTWQGKTHYIPQPNHPL